MNRIQQAVKRQRGGQVACWLASSLTRVFPTSAVGGPDTLQMQAPRNSRLAFQVCLQNQSVSPLPVTCTAQDRPGFSCQVRRVGYVPLWQHTSETAPEYLDGLNALPGLAPDPLYPEPHAQVGPFANQSFWVTVTIASEVAPGRHELKVRLVFPDDQAEVFFMVEVAVSPLVLKPRRDFPVTHWWRAEAIWDWYQTEPFDERWWQIVEPYLANLRSHGSDLLFVPLFFMRREIFRRPAQLLKVTTTAGGGYAFDFGLARRFIRVARQCGFEQFEWPHLWIYWGVEHPIRVYQTQENVASLLWPLDTPATGERFRNFLQQFLPAFHRFLQEEELLAHSYFHLSDEPGGDQQVENYRRARAMLQELAPWMRVIDALSDIRYGREGLTDLPIPLVDAAQAYRDEGIPHWVYYCCLPRGPYLNRFLDTPLPTVRMSGWLFYRLRAQGFLHWGYNYWHKMEREELGDPFVDGSSAGWPNIPFGDPHMVYPGESGPLDSIRWEVFAESLQDYALLQCAGIDPDDPLLAEIRGYADFPRNEAWHTEALARVLRKAELAQN